LKVREEEKIKLALKKKELKEAKDIEYRSPSPLRGSINQNSKKKLKLLGMRGSSVDNSAASLSDLGQV